MKQILKERELSAFSGQLALILHSGISLLEGISILKEDAAEPVEQELLNQIYETLELTGDFTQALSDSNAFPPYFLKLTEVGEKSGTLEEVMETLSSYYSRQALLLRQIREALTYPLVLFCMLAAVLAVLLTQVMPVFSRVFEQLGIPVSSLSQMIFHIGSILQKSSAVLLLLVIAATAFFLYALRSSHGKEWLLSVFRRIPLSRQVLLLISCSRFSHALSVALHSGLDIDESFSLAESLTDQKVFQEGLNQAKMLLAEGMDFGEALRQSGIYSGLNARLVTIGFRTGAAETALLTISQNCQTEAEELISKTASLIEPVMTAVLSLLTGIILVSVMLPLLGVMSNIG